MSNVVICGLTIYPLLYNVFTNIAYQVVFLQTSEEIRLKDPFGLSLNVKHNFLLNDFSFQKAFNILQTTSLYMIIISPLCGCVGGWLLYTHVSLGPTHNYTCQGAREYTKVTVNLLNPYLYS